MRQLKHETAARGVSMWLLAGPFFVVLLAAFTGASGSVFAQEQSAPAAAAHPQLVIFDTDIGDDIDDVLALGLAFSSPELKLLGVTSAWGDTELRARMLDRLLRETGNDQIPVAVGVSKHKQGEAAFSQARWAEREPARPHQPAVDFILEQIRLRPGEITLIEVAPMTNLRAALARDPETFKKLKRIVMMGGGVRKGYDRYGLLLNASAPGPEYNIAMDVEAARKVFGSGVPIYMMPLDSTQLKLDELKREMVFTHSSALTDASTLLYQLWAKETAQATPTMFDAVAVAYAIDPNTCPVTPLRIAIDAEGVTREGADGADVWVCLQSDSDAFFRFYLGRILSKYADAQSTPVSPIKPN